VLGASQTDMVTARYPCRYAACSAYPDNSFDP
jgi:hypothetical protein